MRARPHAEGLSVILYAIRYEDSSVTEKAPSAFIYLTGEE
jgi:hypothetical protein